MVRVQGHVLIVEGDHQQAKRVAITIGGLQLGSDAQNASAALLENPVSKLVLLPYQPFALLITATEWSSFGLWLTATLTINGLLFYLALLLDDRTWHLAAGSADTQRSDRNISNLSGAAALWLRLAAGSSSTTLKGAAAVSWRQWRALRTQIGNPDYLDRFQHDPELDGYRRAFGPDLIVSFLSENIPAQPHLLFMRPALVK